MAPNRRKTSSKDCYGLREEIQGFHRKLSEFDDKLDTLESQVSNLDDDFRKHEEVEKTLLDEVLLAVLKNTESAAEIKKSVSGFVELQEDLTVMMRVIKKITAVGAAFGKFAIVIGVAGTLLKMLYEYIVKYQAGL